MVRGPTQHVIAKSCIVIAQAKTWMGPWFTDFGGAPWISITQPLPG